MSRGDAELGGKPPGRTAEDTAAGYLEEKGYTILERNFRTRRGEVDIICEASGTVVFVEVKGWSTYGVEDLEYAIDRRKRSRIVGAARRFMQERGIAPEIGIRFDIVFVEGGRGRVEHFEGAFDSPWPG